MALNAYLTMTGETQGDIEGSSDIAPHEGKIEVRGFSHQVRAPRDAASGRPTGKRQHLPITITKDIDLSSALLWNMLTNNENITEWRLELYRPARTGLEELYYSIALVNASISDIREEQLNNRYPENAIHLAREHVSFTYQKIIWTWEDGGLTAEDDWETPTV